MDFWLKMQILLNYAVICNIIFVGPSPEAISKMGTKDVARETMKEAGVPIVPGSQGIIKDIEEAIRACETNWLSSYY